MSMDTLVKKIDALLPQTQCGKCGYDGCRPYAVAIAQGQLINRCPPGGEEGIRKLARLLERPVLKLNPECGEHKPLHIAHIQEEHCIGCTLCIQACPVDAVIGASKRMHIIDPDRCTGCDLCVPACPVDCIEMIPAGRTWTSQDAAQARHHYEQHQARQAKLHELEQQRLSQASAAPTGSSRPGGDKQIAAAADDKQAAIAAALAQARARRQNHSS